LSLDLGETDLLFISLDSLLLVIFLDVLIFNFLNIAHFSVLQEEFSISWEISGIFLLYQRSIVDPGF